MLLKIVPFGGENVRGPPDAFKTLAVEIRLGGAAVQDNLVILGEPNALWVGPKKPNAAIAPTSSNLIRVLKGNVACGYAN